VARMVAAYASVTIPGLTEVRGAQRLLDRRCFGRNVAVACSPERRADLRPSEFGHRGRVGALASSARVSEPVRASAS
jgi:hypothetical protein